MTLAELRVLGDRLIVRPDPRPTMSEGGLIHLPETVTHGNEQTLDPNYLSLTGLVVKLGDGLRWSTYACRHCGDEVVVTHPPSGTEKCAGCTYLLSESNTRLIATDEDVQPFEVQVGDRVTFGRFAGRQVAVDDAPERHLIMRESEILGIVDADTVIRQVYEEPTWNKPTKGLTV